MKNLLKYTTLFLFFLKMNGQTVVKEQFLYENVKIDYSFISGKSNNIKFNVIIEESDIKINTIGQKIKNCFKNKKKLGDIFYIVIPHKFNNNKVTFVLELLSDILSKRKLIDKEMNIIAHYDYTKLYEEIRVKNKGKYKNCFLNKINNLSIVKNNDSICNYLY